MKNILSNTKMLAALLMAGAAFTACSEKDNIIEEQPTAAKTYKMTVDASMGGGAQTRALYFNSTSLDVKWASNDHVSVFPAAWSRTEYGTLTAAESDTRSTTLTGDLTTLPAVNENLKLLFPRATWDYTGQKGVLLTDANSIEKKYDYALADVTVNSVTTGNEIATTTANFQNQQAIVKFTLQNQGGNAINASSLTISAASNKLVKNKSYRGAGTKTYYYGNSYYTVDNGSGGHGGEQHGNLVDNNLGNKWCQDKPSGNWYIEFHTASAIQVDGYMLRTGGDTWPETGRNPQSWVLYGKKNSGDSWSVIDTKTDNYDMPNASNAEQDFDADAPGQYQYFRLEISAIRGGICMQMSEMRLFSYEYFEMGTTYGGLTVTPANATSEMTVALRNENASDDTYTLTATVGGATYSFSQSDVTFENGKYYEITAKLTKQTTIDLSTVTTDITVPDGFTLTGTLNGAHKISIADDATVTLNGVTIVGDHGDWYQYAGITCLGDATIILKDGTTNTANGNYGDYPGIQAAASKTLIITGTGSLIASSDSYGAGIGSAKNQTCGNIVISGGTITAVGGRYRGAGIGSGRSGGCGTITISGGTITATGGDTAAGIGSGEQGNCGNITITSTVTHVTATKGSNASNSIGAGSDGNCGTVTIEDGSKVTQN